MIITTTTRDKVFRRKLDGVLFGSTINLGIDYSTGVARTDLASYYEEIDNPIKTVTIERSIESTELSTVISQTKKWATGEKLYAKDLTHPADIREYNGDLYKVIQSHTTQSDWNPSIVPAMFTKLVPEGVINPWVQPLSTNPYMKDAKVIFNGAMWQSTIDNNVWSPMSYPAGWKLV
jgi:hypothetical protein